MSKLLRVGTAFLLGFTLLSCQPPQSPNTPPSGWITDSQPSVPESPASPPASPKPSPSKTARPPQVSQKPKPKPPSDNLARRRTCSSLGNAYLTQIALETDNYYVNICQPGRSDELIYLGQDRYDPSLSLRLPATPTSRGYQARNGNTLYRVEQNTTGRWEISVWQSGDRLVREPALVAYGNYNPPPQQESVTLTCRGQVGPVAAYSVRYTDENGFTQVTMQNRNTGDAIANGTLEYIGQNEQGQSVFKGNAGNADFTLVSLDSPVRRGSQVSASYDGQWGRGTCN